ncbi:MAG: Ig-like domain-containing protein, partial [Deltaproteobacteria bacterium]|nr:Ig-like domain-containing protein [Deltaproteobacteria bacterium]
MKKTSLKRAGQSPVRAGSSWLRGIAATTLMSFLLTSCGGKGATPPQPSGSQMGSASPLSDQAYVILKDAPPGLDLKLTEGRAGTPAFDTSKLPPARKLAAQEAEALLSRTRPIAVDPDDQKAFALRPGSQPAPRTGQTIKGQFPPAPSSLLPPLANDAGKDLKVLRWMPEGQVPLAPELSVTFSQPMIAVTSQDDAALGADQLVKLSPKPKGKWRWIGTRTVLFDPEIRFPQATTYSIEIPAGSKSINGGVLKAPHKFTFETPPPSVTSRYPSGGPQRLDVPMLLAFDQKIDAQAVLANVKVMANGTPVTVKMMDAAEIAKDKKLQAVVDGLVKSEHQGRWLAFRATSPFPKDATISVDVQAGTPSAEGPNKTTKPQTHTFKTYPPLKIVREGCGYQGKCPPGTPFTVQLNNPLDTDKFADEQIRVSPDVPGLKIMQSYSNLTVMGATKARTTYKIVISGGLLDEFGQTLGQDTTLTWKVTDAVPTFFGPQGMVVLDPAAKQPTLDFFTTNYEQLKVRLYQVDPADYDKFGFALRNMWNRDRPPTLPGRKVFDQLVKTGIGKDSLVETHVDLKTALDRTGLGHAIAVVEPYPWKESYEPPRMVSWVQSTKLAVDAYVDADNLIAFVTELGTGKPAGGVALEIRPHGIKGQTDDKGIATLALPVGKALKGAHYLVAKRNNDVAFVSDDRGYWNEYGSWVKQDRPTLLAWYVIDDRKMYKPGEEVTLKGWLRTVSYAKGGDIGGIGGAVQSINYKVTDSRGNEIGKGAIPVSAVGGFDTKFTLPKTPNLGHAYVSLEAKGRISGSHSHSFQVEEFRRPEFAVKAQASQGPFLIGGSGEITVNASYFAGGPLGGAPVNWYVTASPSSFTPPNRDDYVFGTWE